MTATIAVLIVTIVAWSFGWAAFAAIVGLPFWVSAPISFIVVFGFLQSPWYHNYMDWIEDKVSERVK